MLKVHDDGKNKIESFEVWDDSMIEIDRGYGRTEEEAFSNYKKNVASHYKLAKSHFHRVLVNPVLTKVDYAGREI
jgi:hypothetical protein